MTSIPGINGNHSARKVLEKPCRRLFKGGNGISWELFRFSNSGAIFILEQFSKSKAGVTGGKSKVNSEEGQIHIFPWKPLVLWRKPDRNHLHPFLHPTAAQTKASSHPLKLMFKLPGNIQTLNTWSCQNWVRIREITLGEGRNEPINLQLQEEQF